MKKLIPVLVFLLLISTVAFAKGKDYVKATDIQKIDIGDTFEEFEEKIGEPQQILSKELTTDGKEKVIWLYEAIYRPSRGRGLITSTSESYLEEVKAYQLQRLTNPPYLIIFIDGKASSIKRQQ